MKTIQKTEQAALSDDSEYAEAVDKGIFGSQTPGQPEPSDAPSDAQAEQNVLQFYGVKIERVSSRVKTTRALWDFFHDQSPDISWSLSEFANLTTLPDITIVVSIRREVATALADKLIDAGCRAKVVELLDNDQCSASFVQRLDSKAINEAVRISPPETPARVFTVNEFAVRIFRLMELYIENAKDDDPDWLAHLGSLEGGAVDFAKFVEALGGEVTETCSHGKPKSERCEQCVSEGAYTHVEPRA